MNAAPPSFPPSVQAPGLAAGSISFKWAALLEAGTVVATLAGLEPERDTPEMRNFPALIREADGWRRNLAEGHVADLAAMMEPGLAALLAVSARGADVTPAASALWHEFRDARDAILALVPPAGALGPRRSA